MSMWMWKRLSRVRPKSAAESVEEIGSIDTIEAMEMGSSRSKKTGGEWADAESLPSGEADDEEDGPPVELESRIVTEVLSADLNPFNIDNK